MSSVYCTVLSKGRLYQAITLFHSLENVMQDYRVFTLCIDDDTYGLLKKMNLKNITFTHVKELEDAQLLELKKQRKRNEYCWTLKPLFIEKIMKDYPSINRVTYIDADLYFFENPTVIFENQPDCSVLLSRGDIVIPSFDPALIKELQRLLGNYNSGLISFKCDDPGSACLKWWKEKCLEHCVNAPGEGKFGDQGYLDSMPGQFPNVCDIITPGVNIGHWNYAKHRYSMKDGAIFADEAKLICYHFSGYRILNKNDMKRIHEKDRKDSPMLLHNIYQLHVKNAICLVEQIDPDFNGYAEGQDIHS
ncbi:putative nucleotide-diphospho-sugar transferase [Fictibacillus sp. Mic-4]|uniref:putative nucleotide-diphospho-sugar transferase n=1 Tax=Fictibacillus sp. Mic-4 TaxID=3132826 RepID=UPI003CF2D4F1